MVPELRKLGIIGALDRRGCLAMYCESYVAGGPARLKRWFEDLGMFHRLGDRSHPAVIRCLRVTALDSNAADLARELGLTPECQGNGISAKRPKQKDFAGRSWLFGDGTNTGKQSAATC